MSHRPDLVSSSAVAIVTLAVPVALAAFVEGPYPGMTGGFGEPSCHQCHFDNPIDAQPGRLALSGVPETYAAGVRYALKIALSRPGLSRGGFQMTARFDSGPRTGQPAGGIAAIDQRVHTVRDPLRPALMYAQQTALGSLGRRPDEIEWTVHWTAPAPEDARDSIIFHVAANASNDDASPLGDFIHLTTTRSLAPAAR